MKQRIVTAVVGLLTLAILTFLMVGCTQPDKARELLENHGYTDVEMTGYDFWGCSEDDDYHDGFKAKAPVTGAEVEGVVCAGMFFKGATIRLY